MLLTATLCWFIYSIASFFITGITGSLIHTFNKHFLSAHLVLCKDAQADLKNEEEYA